MSCCLMNVIFGMYNICLRLNSSYDSLYLYISHPEQILLKELKSVEKYKSACPVFGWAGFDPGHTSCDGPGDRSIGSSVCYTLF